MAAAPQAAGMDKAVMKRLLSVSKKEPVNCAMAAGPDAGIGLLLDKPEWLATLAWHDRLERLAEQLHGGGSAAG